MLGVLKVILCRNRVATPGLVARQFQVALVASLRALRHLLMASALGLRCS
jgi:hypothetical protein